MTLFGTTLVVLLLWGYNLQSYRIVIDKELNNLKNISEEVALHIESHFSEKAAVALTLSSAPIIKDTLLKSNAEFGGLPEVERKQEINSRNQRWKETADVNDPFILSHITNPIAEYLKSQQIIMPGIYGEIFLTNRYGVMIAATGKLTTLAHAHKYWWIACYDDGRGRIFFDDRGFDTSVQGYVLGVVIPIKVQNEIIGIIKCNVNVMGLLTDTIRKFGMRSHGQMKIVRTGGLIVSELGVTPLSTKVQEEIVDLLSSKKIGTAIVVDDNEKQLVAFSPISATMGSKQFGFGGSNKSIDHIKGNKGEGWHIVISLPEEIAMETAHETTRLINIAGIIFTLLTATVALLLGKLTAKPLVELAVTAKTIGDGNLDIRTNVSSNDEIGSLAQSLNKMTENLQKTMTSRDKLIHEVEQRIQAEEKLQLLATTDELTGAYNRRAFNEYLNKNIGRAKRYQEPLSMLLLDIDHFKKINDTHGHDVGDQILKFLVRVVLESLRQEDIMARWGGEEFTLLMPQTGKNSALQLAERLRGKISTFDFPTAGQVTVSIGLTELHADDDADSFVKRADVALYKAKKGGRNMVMLC